MSGTGVVLIAVAALMVGGQAVGLTMGARALAPARSVFHCPRGMLEDEAETMIECVERHEPKDFHGRSACHDDHASAELAEIPFENLVLLTGDVPEPGYFPVNEILPYRDQPGKHVALLDFLADHGVQDFESVTLASRGRGLVTREVDNLTPYAMLLPHVDGTRCAAENLCVSTWLKVGWRMVVAGVDRQLLLGPTRSLTIEQTDVTLRSEEDGQIRNAKRVSRFEGVASGDILTASNYDGLAVRDAEGQESVLQAAEAKGAMLALLRERPKIVLVLPDRSRANRVTGVTVIGRVE